MSVLYLLIIAALTVAIGFLIAFIWAVRAGQFDDTHTPSMRILIDEEDQGSSKKNIKE
ncbi:MAG: cbb3-type cytochrome oxidase assembly protein CcoS [Planctomycetia bacterium]|nr:cbb3-type cytochrome oxidase assembly protein CcoS [Planctomycetia bacterium]